MVKYSEVAALTGSFAQESGDRFGESVSINSAGDIVAVGARSDDLFGTSLGTGITYIMQKIGGTWREVAALTGSFAQELGDNFGYFVSINSTGDIVAVGARNDETVGAASSTGVTYIMQNIGGTWREVAALTGSFAQEFSDFFGYSVSINSAGDIVAVGATGDEAGAALGGVTYIMQNIGGTWREVAALTGSFAQESGDNFGYSVSINSTGDILAVGATGDEAVGAVNGTGVTYIMQNIGGTWREVAALTGSSANSDQFGQSVSINSAGDIVAVGVPNEEAALGSSTGITFIMQNIGGTWREVAALTGSFALQTFDLFGWSVSINSAGDIVAVGASQDEVGVATNTGITYIMQNIGGTWREVGALTGSFAQESNDNFGYSVSINSAGDIVAVGAWQDEVGEAAGSTGVTYVFNKKVTSEAALSVNSVRGVGINADPYNFAIRGQIKYEEFQASTVTNLVLNTNNYIVINSSSKRFKENIVDYTSSLDVIDLLSPVSFNYKNDKKTVAGLLAEDLADNNVEEYLIRQNNKPFSIMYGNINSLLINGIKELDQKIENMEKEIDAFIASGSL